MWFVCGFLGFLVLQAGLARGAGDLALTVTPLKQGYVLGEPVYVDVEIKNVSSEDQTVSDDPLLAGTVIRILPPGGEKRTGWSRGSNMLVPVRFLILSPGHWLKDRALISHDFRLYNFPVPGTYKVWAEYAEGGLEASCAPVDVVVTEPSGVDLQPNDLFFSEEARCFISYGSYGGANGPGITPAIADFERIVSGFPTSTYAPYAAYYLALRKSKPGRYSLGPEQPSDPIPPDYVRAIELGHFAEARTDFPLKGEARLLQASATSGSATGRKLTLSSSPSDRYRAWPSEGEPKRW
jgi:hypothetical protein